MFSMLLFAIPLIAKGWIDFKLNPDYTVSYPENWYRVDPGSPKFSINSTEAREGDTPANLQIKISELTSAEAALPWKEFVEIQLQKHIKYLNDNWIEDPKIGEPDTLSVHGAELAFHLRTDIDDAYDSAVLITDYARKGNKLYLLRFYCPVGKFEKYLSDYYVIRGTFKLR